MSEPFLIKHRSSGKFFHPYGGNSNPDDGTAVVLHSSIHERMHWRFCKVTNKWGYIEHVASGKCIHPRSGHKTLENETGLVIHSDRHSGALFALDGKNDHIIHKAGIYAHPQGGSHDPGDNNTVVLHSSIHDRMRFQFVSPYNPSKQVCVDTECKCHCHD
ncbi:galactose-binding lectin-like [Mya arenaria]|uniref:galactose-binding lectin-like n=1 Tax=Mya arenaria TaxID=6604 RepID=UPI0022E94131|nr:galactose-binding lectin-like [Mya arenaria]